MINAANLPAVRARADADQAGDASRSTATAPTASPPSYPSKTLVLENGRYVVADSTK